MVMNGFCLGLVACVALAICPAAVFAQDDHGFHHHHLAVFLGGTTPLDSASGGKTSFTIGADYEYRITPVVGHKTA